MKGFYTKFLVFSLLVSSMAIGAMDNNLPETDIAGRIHNWGYRIAAPYKLINAQKAFMQAISYDDVNKVVQLMEQFPALIKMKNSIGVTPLMWASQCSSLQVLPKLVYLWDIDAQDKFGRTALFCAVAKNCCSSTTVIKKLIGAGADPNIPDNDRRTPLFQAVSNANAQAVKILLKAGACDDVKPTMGHGAGMTAMELAEDENYFEVMRILSHYS